MAKSASAAVRMSLDLLQLTSDEEFVLQQGEEEEESGNGDETADGENTQGGEGDPDSKAKVSIHQLLLLLPSNINILMAR
jgi:hypothetical protein